VTFYSSNDFSTLPSDQTTDSIRTQQIFSIRPAIACQHRIVVASAKPFDPRPTDNLQGKQFSSNQKTAVA
jgi:hypothetical protein